MTYEKLAAIDRTFLENPLEDIADKLLKTGSEPIKAPREFVVKNVTARALQKLLRLSYEVNLDLLGKSLILATGLEGSTRHESSRREQSPGDQFDRSTRGSFSLHTHPPSIAELFHAPSDNDLTFSASRSSKTDVEFVVTKRGIIAYKATREVWNAYEYPDIETHSDEEIMESLKSVGIVSADISWEDSSRIDVILQVINGTLTWSDAKEMLKNA